MTTAPDPDFDLATMRMALEEARKSLPSPNPPVGAVVVSADGEVVGAAHHARAGEDHAEVAALRSAGEAARGGTLFVTLEPCNHQGRTPPCVDTILKAGIKRVVVGCPDPNPNVVGGGARRLSESGVTVDVGIGGGEARAVIAPWTKFITSGMPYVSLKLALSLDGRIATRSGASKWVTGPEARAKVQELRAQHDAVAVGIGTAVADDPRLTVRVPGLAELGRRPTRMIFDTHLRLPLHGRLVQTARDVPTWVLTGEDAPEAQEQSLVDAGCVVMRVPNSAEGRVDVAAALRILASQGIVSILIEGGAELAGSILASRLVDELHAFIAPILLGPRGRPGAVDWAGPDTPSDAPRIVDPRWELCGRDAYVSGPLAFPR
ncbi:bifunctional diaminohydroxyphosphoribosylaminopyrimidine deaminase/5-amino-6-(5-phosphoribosylamino)uracil reductase RibD [Polyangium aurulentum]|uniref:bifunctional diaminohydroxyphosphoribosylaminopyrimidine deaminase/5-amino-6-(5-phosphoribosylamino)uracil reductase RibD n=1 Tax=Polyangium aurulentum TaxID=2567896 RepID=UPI0010AEE620|nr:bifunctional diaminohydroxyphosphoribosylaminopyrimidine deaminase/5-amino-6-(5-phosphoribosylamino)uracil reductase RibD [Polyangium aurulentum]UQA56067.1 bifunctional diaminohydroxyphosphoribosylaminopyrimidine deaminase/5-amino-6-(5-phosphoribosylamino)uracil reductase RibD [Polyangium aurulentum]